MKKTFLVSLTIFSLIFSVYLLGLLANLQIVEASATIYIRTDGSIDPPTANITTSDNVTYTIIGNINEPIDIERNDILIDGARYTINGSGTSAGFILNDVSNVTIKNTIIIGFYYGLYLNSTSEVNIQHNNITANSFDAVHIIDSTRNIIAQNNITDNGNDGVKLWGFTNSNIITGNNIIRNNDDGIAFARGSSEQADCSNSIISGNNVTGNSDVGISVSYSSNISITTNDVNSNSYGISIFNCSDCILKENKLAVNKWDGLGLLLFSNSSITGNNITKNQDGIDFNRCHNNTISSNYVVDNWENGFYILSSSHNIFPNNRITSNLYGLQLEWSSNNTFSQNIISHNGIGVDINVSFTSGNRFFHNNFVNNTQQTTIVTGSWIWDNGFEGNYWSDYADVDLNNDGIGDNPHVINWANNDSFPLMGMFSNFNTSLGFYVNVISNSTIDSFDFFKSPANSTIEMYVLNITSVQEDGFCRVCIPHVLMTEQYDVSVNGSNPNYANYTLYDNKTHRWIFFSYNHSTVEVIIQGVDNEPPIIDLLSPQNKTYAVRDIPLQFNIYEPTSWIGYSLNEQTNQTIQGNTELTSLPDGSHTITVYVNDTAGNMGSTTEWFTVDTTVPTITILSPENKSYATGSIPLNFTINEPTSWIGYSLNEQTNQTIQGNITLPTLPDGSHNIIVYANDTTGNMAASNKIHFTIDTVYPTIEILSPQNITYTTSTPQLNFTINEPTSWIGYSLNEQTNQTIQGNITLPTLPDGSHNIIVYANDTTGNMAASNKIHFTIDATPPEISNVSQTPSKDNVNPDDEVRVNATVTDIMSGIQRVILNYTTNNGTWFNVEMFNLEGNIYNGTIPSFDYCTYVNYTIMAEDTVGNIITTEDMAYELDYHVVPEFVSPMIMMTVMIIISLALVIFKRKSRV